jgi:hypothetical protein
MNYLNGLMIVALLGGGGKFLGVAIRRRDASSILLSAALMALGLAEVCELILSVEFSILAIKSWYFLTKLLLWGLLGTGILLKLPLSPQQEPLLTGAVLLGLLAGLGLIVLTQITAAGDWFAPEQSIWTQYVDLMARNRPTRWLTLLFNFYGLGLVLSFAAYNSLKTKMRPIAFLALALGGILLSGQEYAYHRVGEGLGDSFHLLGGAILFLVVSLLMRDPEREPVRRSKIAAVIGWLVVVGIVVLGASIRLRVYGDICSAVVTSDSQKFLALSGQDVLSIDFITANRPAFITFFYKLAGVNPEMLVTEYSEPERIIPRQVYADLNCVSGWQTALSIFSWSVLALALARKLRSAWLQVIMATLVLGFAYLPQLADWDFVIQSESISFSMWALTFALSIELGWRIFRSKGISQDRYQFTWWVFLAWGVVLVLWGFSRDTNIYMVLLIGVASLMGLMIHSLREHIPVRLMVAIGLLCLAFFGLQNSLLYRSDRWMNPFFNNLMVNILPYPEREAWFIDQGLPTIEPAYRKLNLLGRDGIHGEISELIDWTTEKGSGLYTRYILTHPGWALQHFWKWSSIPFTENRQTYIKPDLDTISPYPYALGDIFHPKSRSVIWVQLAMLMGLTGLVVFGKANQKLLGLLIVLGLFFVGEIGMLFVSIHGDALGIIRHALVSVMPLRFNIWLLVIFLLDSSQKTE